MQRAQRFILARIVILVLAASEGMHVDPGRVDIYGSVCVLCRMYQGSSRELRFKRGVP